MQMCRRDKSAILLKAAASVMMMVAVALLTSCYTGVEGTKKIKLSRGDLKAIQATDEEMLMKPVAGATLGEWLPGRLFVAADDRAALVFDPRDLPADPLSLHLAGRHLAYAGTETRILPDGSEQLTVLLRDSVMTFRYNTGKAPVEAVASLTSAQIPMLVDTRMVAVADSLLRGRRLWTRSSLWYGENGETVDGRKFVPVTVSKVTAGSMVFPFKVGFVTDGGAYAFMYMSAGNSGIDSRPFAGLFSLTDPRRRYGSIDDATWSLICDGKVTAGMTKEECRLALGSPRENDNHYDYGRVLEIWKYSDGTYLLFEDGRLVSTRK